jgi:nicotinic acid mononucleotide adenylyltransferase
MPSDRWAEPSLRDRLDEVRRAGRPTLVLPEIEREPSSVALLSGSFDPITIAHAALADAASRRAELVLLLYSVRTLPKEGEGEPPLLSEQARLRALEAFCRTRPGLAPALASHGLLGDQVEAARSRFLEGQLFLVMGSDKALQLLDPKWYDDRDEALARLFADAKVLYADRSGQEGVVEEVLHRPENERWRSSFGRLAVPPEVAAVSSREVRQRISRGEDVKPLVPMHRFLPAS